MGKKKEKESKRKNSVEKQSDSDKLLVSEEKLIDLLIEIPFLQLAPPLRITFCVAQVLSQLGFNCEVMNVTVYKSLDTRTCDNLQNQGVEYLAVLHIDFDTDPEAYIQVSSLFSRNSLFDIPLKKFTAEQVNDSAKLYVAVVGELIAYFEKVKEELLTETLANSLSGISSNSTDDNNSLSSTEELQPDVLAFIEDLNFSRMKPLPPRSTPS